MPYFKNKNKQKDNKNNNMNKPLFKRRKFCKFTAEKIEWVDYKDINILQDLCRKY